MAIALLPEFTPVLLHHIAMDIWTDCSVVSQVRGHMSVLPEVTAVLLHHSFMDIRTDCNFGSKV